MNTIPDPNEAGRVYLLKNASIFSGADPESLLAIAAAMQELDVVQGQRIFAAGDPADSMFIISEGTFRVHDHENVLNILGPGDIFGEYALLDGNRRTASVTAISDAHLLRLPASDFHRILREDSSVTLSLIRSLVTRITKEKDKSEKLLQNILPYEVAEELKQKGKVDVKLISKASVLFTDFSGFTRIAGIMSPADLIAELNVCFTEFDHIISKYRIEKIKTIGDAYMCVGGVPAVNKSNAVDAVLAALEIRDFMNRRYREAVDAGGDYWKCRIGVHTGSLIAGIVGVKKFAYDIWGDTVNIASRMESCGEPGMVNISRQTYEAVKDFFDCSFRGGIEAKGKGCLAMYFVNKILSRWSEDGQGTRPSDELLKELESENNQNNEN